MLKKREACASRGFAMLPSNPFLHDMILIGLVGVLVFIIPVFGILMPSTMHAYSALSQFLIVLCLAAALLLSLSMVLRAAGMTMKKLGFAVFTFFAAACLAGQGNAATLTDYPHHDVCLANGQTLNQTYFTETGNQSAYVYCRYGCAYNECRNPQRDMMVYAVFAAVAIIAALAFIAWVSGLLDGFFRVVAHLFGRGRRR
jgi:hypothetical protein